MLTCRECGQNSLLTDDDQRSGLCHPCRLSKELGVAVDLAAARCVACDAVVSKDERQTPICRGCQHRSALPADWGARDRKPRPCGRCGGTSFIRSLLRIVGNDGKPTQVRLSVSRSTSAGSLYAVCCEGCGDARLQADLDGVKVGIAHGAERLKAPAGYRDE